MRQWHRIGSGIALALALLAVPGPAFAGPPYETDDPEPVEPGHWEVYAYSAGAIGSHDVTGLGPSVEVNYGAAPNLQLHAMATTAYDAPSGGPAAYGAGDAELGFKYRFINPGKGDWYPEVAIFPAVSLPTGRAGRNLGAGQVQVFLPVWLQKNFGKWTTCGGGGYHINPGPGNRNSWFSGWLVQRRMTEKLALGAELFHQTASTDNGTAVTGFNLGGQYDLSGHHHLLFSAGHGGLAYAVNGAAVSRPMNYYLGWQWTF